MLSFICSFASPHAGVKLPFTSFSASLADDPPFSLFSTCNWLSVLPQVIVFFNDSTFFPLVTCRLKFFSWIFSIYCILLFAILLFTLSQQSSTMSVKSTVPNLLLWRQQQKCNGLMQCQEHQIELCNCKWLLSGRQDYVPEPWEKWISPSFYMFTQKSLLFLEIRL